MTLTYTGPMLNKSMQTNNTILVTGSAGFIGFHATQRLLLCGYNVIGIDNFNAYYDISLKEQRNSFLSQNKHFTLYRGDISDLPWLQSIFQKHPIQTVCHLAAQAGVRYSIQHPEKYIESNIVGFFNILEVIKENHIQNLIFASSSSVYGNNSHIPFSESAPVDHPVSLYAATKKSNELMAYTYHHLYGIHCTGLRFFTVYGPWGRPDMAYYSFTKNIINNSPIQLYNHGKLKRDFTYIDDIVDGVLSAIEKKYPYEIINLGNNSPVSLEYFITVLETSIGKKARKQYCSMQAGDVLQTYADIKKAEKLLEFKPKTQIEDGLANFVRWYKDYYNIN